MNCPCCCRSNRHRPFTFTEVIMKVPQCTSELLRQFVRCALCEAGLSQTDLAERVCPWVARSTLARTLSTEHSFTEEQVDVILHAVSRLCGFDPMRTRRVIYAPLESVALPEAELAWAASFSA